MYLINDNYLRSKCIVRHISFDPLDNRLENLWICENEHIVVVTSLNFLINNILKSGFIIFRNSKYLLNL